MELSDQRMLLISIAVALLGLALLWVAVRALEQSPLEYEEFLAADEGVRVVLNGTVARVSSLEEKNVTFLDLETRCTIPAIIFEEGHIHKKLEGENVLVIGKKEFYEGKPEILIESITLK